MTVNTEALMEVLVQLANAEDLNIIWYNHGIGMLSSSAVTILGLLFLGPVGFAVGGTLGGLLGWYIAAGMCGIIYSGLLRSLGDI